MQKSAIGVVIYYCKLYNKIMVLNVKTRMSYRADFIVSVVGYFLMNILGFLEFRIILNSISNIAGYSYYELVFLYSFMLVAIAPVQCFFDNNWNLGDALVTGDFIKYRIKPINTFFYFLSEKLAIENIGQLVLGIVMMYVSGKKLNLDTSTGNMIFGFVALLSSSLIMAAMINFSAAVSFWILQSSYAMQFMYKIKDYARYPARIYNNILKVVFTFIFPITLLAYYPCSMFFDSNNSSKLFLLILLGGAVGIFSLSYVIWMKGANLYSGTGS